MKTSYRYLFTISIIVILSAEILVGSTPLINILSPLTWIFVFLPYSLLIICLAYLTSHTKTLSSNLILLPIAGLVIEGAITRSFFDITYPQLTDLANVGYWMGIQWPWTISLIASHMMTSFVLPLAIATIFKPLQKRIIGLQAAKIASIAMGIFVVVTFAFRDALSQFGIEILCTTILVVLLAYLSQKIRIPDARKKILQRPCLYYLVFSFRYLIG
jgi:hypothetical protein